VFQNPFSTFNYFYTVDRPLLKSFDLLEGRSGEKKKYSKTEKEEILRETLATIGVDHKEVLGRYPHQLSGGQMQRLLIARSLIIGPDILVADEPTSMTDASTRLAILNELLRLKQSKHMSVLFITHDMGQAYYISDRTAVMQKGRIMEMGHAEKVLFHPETQYTQDLIKSVPKLHEKWEE
jgi:peptide/nickel transport system ATP-binding protein